MKKVLIFPTVFLGVFLGCFGYWLKCQLGINVVHGFSLHPYFPFSYLQKNMVISLPHPGIVLQESFEPYHLINPWSSQLWVREKGAATMVRDTSGMHNSHCLLIRNGSTASWSLAQDKFVEVRKGDTFSFSGYINMHGENVVSFIGVSAFDGQRKAIKRNYVSTKAPAVDTWVKVEQSFTIEEDNIQLIKLRLTGSGRGEFRFDDIIFRKENP
jgi:hypothetical protein